MKGSSVKNKLSPLRHGLVIALLGLLMALLPITDPIEAQYGLNWLFSVRGEIPPPRNVAIVAINRESSIALNLPYQAERWPRQVYAQLIERLHTAGVRSIAFDVLFRDPRSEEEDQALAQAISAAGNVILLEKLMVDRHSWSAQTDPAPLELLVTQQLSPLPLFSSAAATTAPFLVPKVPVQVQQTWLYNPSDLTPTLPTAAYRVYREQLGRQPQGAQTLSTLPLLPEAPATRYLNFYGAAGTLRTLDADQVIAGKTSELRDSAVFVGYSERNAQEQKDHFFTVYSGDDGIDMAGVEIAATTFANLLTNQFITPLPRWLQALLLFIWGGVIGSIAFVRSIPVAYTTFAALLGLYLLTAFLLFTHQLLWLPLVTSVAVQGAAALFLSIIWRYRVSSEQRQSITRALEPYAPHQVVDELIHTGQRSTGSQRRFGVCIYTDIIKSTRMTEALGDELWSEIANDYFDYLFEPAQRRGAVLSDLAGDSMLAYWTADNEDPKMLQAACLAALEIQQTMHRFRHPAINHPLLSRIGVNCGWVREGDTKVGQQLRYGIRGHMVNMAARIEGLNKTLGTQLLVAQDTLQGQNEIAQLNLGAFTLEGARSAITIYQLFAHDDPYAQQIAQLTPLFSEALAAFNNRQWTQAEALFSGILQHWPEHGPTHFYANLCRRYAQTPPCADWDGSIAAAKN